MNIDIWLLTYDLIEEISICDCSLVNTYIKTNNFIKRQR